MEKVTPILVSGTIGMVLLFLIVAQGFFLQEQADFLKEMEKESIVEDHGPCWTYKKSPDNWTEKGNSLHILITGGYMVCSR